jgi:hypothetical protein
MMNNNRRDLIGPKLLRVSILDILRSRHTQISGLNWGHGYKLLTIAEKNYINSDLSRHRGFLSLNLITKLSISLSGTFGT